MHQTEERCIVTFPSTASAMEMERRAKETGTPGRLIPTPTVITATCGLAWMAPLEARERVEELLHRQALVYEAVQVVAL